METPPKTARIPRATIQRLATYIQVLENLARDGTEIISSTPLAEACGVNGSQIRKDLAYFGEFGIRGVGYNVTSLIEAITSALDVNREWRMAVVGIGNLGKAALWQVVYVPLTFVYDVLSLALCYVFFLILLNVISVGFLATVVALLFSVALLLAAAAVKMTLFSAVIPARRSLWACNWSSVSAIRSPCARSRSTILSFSRFRKQMGHTGFRKSR